MGPELELKARSDGIEALGVKENGGLSVNSKDQFPKCESNCEDYAMGMDKSIAQPLLADGNKGMEVKITEFTTPAENGLVEAECQDTTESSSSSSFDGTVSDTEDATNTFDSEAGSDLFDDNSFTLDINGFSDLLRMRKKKLTSHWRTFIRPLMWRCKWVELQVKKLRAQSLKYDRELAGDDKRNFPVEGFSPNSLPFPSDGPTDKVMKRKKRRRTEDTVDLSSYMSKHNLFSYYENKIHTADGSALDEGWGNQVNSTDKINGSDESEVNGDRLWLESEDGSNSLEELLRHIGLLKMQASRMRSRLDKLMIENAGKFACADSLGLVIASNLTSSARSPASPPNIGDRMPVGSSNIPSQLIPPYNMGNMVIPGGPVPSHREVSYIPDVTEGTDQSLLRGAFIKTEDEILIYDERFKVGMNNYDLSIQPMEKPLVTKEESGSIFTKALTERELQTDLQPALKVRSIAKLTASKNRRKRGRRKAGSGKRSRRSSG